MRNTIIGIVIGVVIGVVFGTTVIAPKLVSDSPSTRLKQLSLNANKTKSSLSNLEATKKITTGPLVPAKSTNPVVRWKMASAYGSTLPQLGALGKRLEKQIWHVSGGRIEIKFYEPGTLVPSKEFFDAVAAGVIDAAFSTPNNWENRIPALQLFSAVPFGPRQVNISPGLNSVAAMRLPKKFTPNTVFTGFIVASPHPLAQGGFESRFTRFRISKA